ncbi:trypsin-like peptidase domain-containing protein [Phormidium tenue FACHB-886]|nr:trypsin-like peptidase domain-containing protein [Phormidium tenue FACHB-886]
MSDGASLLAISNEFTTAVEKAGQFTVAVNGRRRFSSSGVHWRSGIIVTADHAVKREEDLTVTLPDERTVAATLVGRDSGTDLAVLRLEEGDLPTAELADTAALKVGQWVLAVARSADSGVAASMGVISALGGAWRTWHGGQIDQLIRPDLSLYPGFSGGALVTPQGQAIGINTSGYRHMALTLPAATVNRMVDQLVNRGRIARGYLGVGMQPVQLPDSLKASLQLSNDGGVIVVSVQAGSPADRAGILIGDILIALDEQPTADIAAVHRMLDPERVDSPLVAKLIRGGALTEVTVTVGERPQQEGKS